jgi:hypothetical protein
MTNYESYMKSDKMMDALMNSSVSLDDARIRATEYAKMFSRNENDFGFNHGTNLLQKTFSGYAETPLLSTQYFNASVASYVSSFAGFMSIERDFDQPNGLFYWFDVLGVTDMRSVIPNLGPDDYKDINSMGGFEANVSISDQSQAYDVTIGRKLIPGTVRVKVSGTSAFELVDDGQGNFMAKAGVMKSGSLNYLSGRVQFELSNKPAGTGAGIKVIGKEDVTGTPCNTTGASNTHANDKRFVAKMQQLGLQTVPDMLVAEYNIAALGAMKKATGADMASFLFTKLRELYTKMINYKLVDTLQSGYTGDTMDTLDLSPSGIGFNTTSEGSANNVTFTDYRSRVDLFDAYLINVETALAQKAVKGVTTTAYVAGTQAASQFQKGGIIGKFKRNDKMTYISDLLGWYDGIPVLRSTDIKEEKIDGVTTGTFYAIHKTPDGQMAPLARGIYMPLTDTPTIGNYNNPTQMASGIYYQEGTKYLAPELVQKVTFKVGL